MSFTKPHIFQDAAIQAKFDRDGYVVIDLISATAAADIASIFYKHYEQVPAGFFSVAFNPDDTVKKEIFDFTDQILEPALYSNLKDFKKLGSTFLSKAKGEDGKVGVHQDWYVVDELKYYSATIWVPTEDANEQNGTLKVLPGSHLFFDTYRSNHIPVRYRGHEQFIWDNMITVPIKAGQAFVLNHAVIHASAPNQTDKERLVIAYGVAPINAALSYFHQNEKGLVEQYAMPDDFFQRYYNIGERPLIGQLVNELVYPVPSVTEPEIRFLLHQAKKMEQGSLPGSADIPLTEEGYLAIPDQINEPRTPWLTISIPAYNDEKSLLKLVEDVRVECEKHAIPFNILIINDGSTDSTAEVANSLSGKYNNISVFQHNRNLGFGPTLKEVFTTPKTEWVLFLPGDNQFPATNLGTFLRYKNDFDYILGKRSIRKDSVLRLLYAGFYNRLVSFLSGYKVDDVNGIVFFKSAVFEQVKLQSASSFIHAEFFLETKRNGYKVAEIAIEHREREFGSGSGGKWSVIVPSVIDLFFYVFKNKKKCK